MVDFGMCVVLMGCFICIGDDVGMFIYDWFEQECFCEKLIVRGFVILFDVELLVLFFGLGFGGCDVVQIVCDLLQVYGLLCVLLDCLVWELVWLFGLGLVCSCVLVVGLELVQCYLVVELQQGEVVGNNFVVVGCYLQYCLCGQVCEIFMVLFFDNCYCLIVCEELFQGIINVVLVYFCEVVWCVLLYNVVVVIFSYNYFFGDLEFFGVDICIIDELQQVLVLVDVCLLDYFVVGEGCFVLFVE